MPYYKIDLECAAVRVPAHRDNVITCLALGERGLVVSGSDDCQLRLWDMADPNPQFVYSNIVHLRGITFVFFFFQRREPLHVLLGHVGGVWCVAVAGDLIVSGATDRTLRMWSVASGLCRHTLVGHTSTVRCVLIAGNTIVSGARDATVCS